MVNLLKDGATSFEAGDCDAALRAYTQALALCEKTNAREFYAEAAWELHRTQLACGTPLLAPPEVARTCAESLPLLRDEGLLADAEQAALPPMKRYAPQRPRAACICALRHCVAFDFAAARLSTGRRGTSSSVRPRRRARWRRSRRATAISCCSTTPTSSRRSCGLVRSRRR